MKFDSFSAALTMGGHGQFVWLAYAVTVLMIAWLLVSFKRGESKAIREINGELRRQAAEQQLDTRSNTDAPD